MYFSSEEIIRIFTVILDLPWTRCNSNTTRNQSTFLEKRSAYCTSPIHMNCINIPELHSTIVQLSFS